MTQKLRKSGEEYMHHPLNVAYILTDLQADSDTISAALLHDTVHIGKADINDIKNNIKKPIKFFSVICFIILPQNLK